MNRKAVALVLGLSLIVLLAVLATGILTRSVSEGSFSARHITSTQAFWAAEAGLQRGLWELNHGDGNWTGWSGNSNDKSFSKTMGNNISYLVSIAGINSNNPFINSTGNAPLGTNFIQRSLILSTDKTQQTPFQYAGFGRTGITVSGNGQTDSYNSNNGPYDAGTAGSNGDIGTNAGSSGAIDLSGNTVIHGDANTGPGGTVATGPNAHVLGTVDDVCAENYMTVKTPSTLLSLINGGSKSVNNNQTLSAGDYKYSSLSIGGNGTLTLSGAIRLYITGDLSIAGNGSLVVNNAATIYLDGKADIAGNGMVNNSQKPSNLLLFSSYTGSSDGVKIAGNGSIYAAVYAPDTEIKVAGNGHVYGSLVAKKLAITGNALIHYDEALGTLGAECTVAYAQNQWRDTQNPYPLE